MYAPCGQRHSEGISFRHFRGEILTASNHGEGLRGFVVRGNYMKSCGYFVRRGIICCGIFHHQWIRIFVLCGDQAVGAFQTCIIFILP